MGLPQLAGGDVGQSARDKINAGLAATDANAGSILALYDAAGGLQRQIAANAGIVDGNTATLNARVDALVTRIAALGSDLTADIAAAATALAQEVSDRTAALAAEADARGAADADLLLRSEAAVLADRPGDARAAFTFTSTIAGLAGPRASLPILPAAMVAVGDAGAEARVTGPGIIAMRRAVAVEPGRLYQPRVALQRRANPSDPSGDAIRFGIAWLDRGYGLLPFDRASTVVHTYQALVTGNGRQERQALFSRSPAPQAAFVAPAAARYAVAYVQHFGPDGVTGVEVLGIDDVSEGSILDPETASTVQAVAALASLNAGPRLDAIESRIGSPKSVTFASRSDAQAGTIPDSVNVVELLGAAGAGDGGWAQYVRVPAAPVAGVDYFRNTATGAYYARVSPAAAIAAAYLSAGMPAWAGSLPTVPGAAGTPWNNGGVPVVVGIAGKAPSSTFDRLASTTLAITGRGSTGDASDFTVTLPSGVDTALLEAFRGALTVDSYGADPTGVADSTQAFQRAYDAAPCLRLGAGRYRLNGPVGSLTDGKGPLFGGITAGASRIVCGANAQIRVSGPGWTIQHIGFEADDVVACLIRSGGILQDPNWKIHNCQFIADSLAADAHQKYFAIVGDIYDSWSGTIAHNFLRNGYYGDRYAGTGFRFHYSCSICVTANVLTCFADAYVWTTDRHPTANYQCEGHVLTANHFNVNGRHCWFPEGLLPVMQGNVFDGTKPASVSVHSAANCTVMKGNWIACQAGSDSGSPVLLDGGAWSIVEGNVFAWPDGKGGQFSAVNAKYVIYRGNQHLKGSIGLAINGGCDGWLVDGNLFYQQSSLGCNLGLLTNSTIGPQQYVGCGYIYPEGTPTPVTAQFLSAVVTVPAGSNGLVMPFDLPLIPGRFKDAPVVTATMAIDGPYLVTAPYELCTKTSARIVVRNLGPALAAGTNLRVNLHVGAAS